MQMSEQMKTVSHNWKSTAALTKTRSLDNHTEKFNHVKWVKKNMIHENNIYGKPERTRGFFWT